MAHYKSYTDIEQSRKLAKILPIESTDNVIVSIGDRQGVKTITIPKETFNILGTPFADIRNTIPCWTFAALFGILPYCPDLSKHTDGKWYITTYPNDVHTCLMAYDNPIDACVAMIEKLHELNLL